MSFFTTMAISDFSLSSRYPWPSLAISIPLWEAGRPQWVTSYTFSLSQPSSHFELSVIRTSCFLAQSSSSRANMGYSALFRGLPSDPPHVPSRPTHYLLANASRLFGRIRDLHPIAYVLPLAKEKRKARAFLDFLLPLVCWQLFNRINVHIFRDNKTDRH